MKIVESLSASNISAMPTAVCLVPGKLPRTNSPLANLCRGAESLEASSSTSSQFLRLPHPRTGTFCLHQLERERVLLLPHRSSPSSSSSTHQEIDGLLELQAVTPPSHASRSYFVGNRAIADGRLFVLSKFDPLFLAIPILLSLSANNSASSKEPLTVGGPQHLETILKGAAGGALERFYGTKYELTGGQEDDLLKLEKVECFVKRMDEICEVESATPQKRYLLSLPRLTQKLQSRIEKIQTEIFRTSAAPSASMDDVSASAEGTSKLSEVPAYPSIIKQLVREGLWGEASRDLSSDVLLQARQQAALETLSNYLPPTLTHHLSTTVYAAFPALQAHASKMKIVESLSASNISLPTPPLSATTSATSVAGEEKKKKAKGPRGVETLKKVDTKGMKRLDSFFAAKPKPIDTETEEKDGAQAE
ncbi:hypothetical protein BT69DRAFT_1316768 [Atractiella rhizophila]|nr:hypothetical protein BT69DRAFT_1316768 [Atractiella rhizophila]